MKQQTSYHAGKFALNFGMLAAGVGLLFILDNLFLQLLDAVFLAFVFVQISLLAHDCGHRQFTFKKAWKNDAMILFLGNLSLGVSQQWWIDKHNAHHGHPNQMDVDPDIDIPLLAFEEEQIHDKRGIAKFIVKYQAIMIFPLAFLQAVSMHLSSARFILGNEAKKPVTEAVVILAHFAIYFGVIFTLLNPVNAILFVVVHRGLYGMYMVSIFAPNHKAMPILGRDLEVDFLHRQVLTSRNVLSHPITDFWYGGLNYQIEHHLFPRMPRNRLREAQPIVQEFCRKHEIGYHETSVLQSYGEILTHLHAIGKPLRNPA